MLHRRATACGLGLLLLAVLGWQAVGAGGAVSDPTAAGARLSHGAVVFDSALLVFREGLESILVIAAVTASFRGAHVAFRRPVAVGAAGGLGLTVATWFLAVATLGSLGASALDIQAATGVLAVIVLLVVMNWFFHRVYWTGWIAHHHRRRRRLVEQADHGAAIRRTVLGLGLLGLTSVYREGFEVVLFLQDLRLKYGSGVVLEGAAIGVGLTAAVGIVTFATHRRLPYKRLLVVTGVMLGVVLIVMVGESVQELQLAGWLSVTTLGVAFPGWLGMWFAVFPTVEGLLAQGLAALLVLGSYVLAEEVRVKRPRQRGDQSAARPVAPPPRNWAGSVRR